MSPEYAMDQIYRAELITIAIMVGINLAIAGISYYRAQRDLKNSQPPSPTGDDIQFPVVTASAPIPVLFGTRRISAPNVVWYGDTLVFQRNQYDVRDGIFRFGGNLALCFCLGPVDSIQRILIGENTADDTPRDLTAGPVSFNISKEQLFGGFSSEGGVSGRVTLYPGRLDQVVDPYLNYMVRGDSGSDIMPAHRGVLSVVLGELVTEFPTSIRAVFYHGTSPVIKPWAVEARRVLVRGYGDAQWYPAKAAVDGRMNPAHIIRELITDEQWGLGLDAADVDGDAFTAAADAFFAEDLAFSFLWNRDTSVFDFMREVERHADCLTYVDPFTGKWIIKAIRDDYDVEEIPTVGPSEVIEVSRFGRPSEDELSTMVSITYRDLALDRDEIAIAHDTAGVMDRGEISYTASFPGVTDAATANKIAQRELDQASTPRATVELVMHDHAAANLLPGHVFNLSWPEYGITRITLRVINVNWGSPTSGASVVQCVEDAFSYGRTVYADPTPTRWVDPTPAPADSTDFTIFEMPLLLRAIEEGVNPEGPLTPWQTLYNSENGRACMGIPQPSTGHLSFEMWVDTSGQDPAPVERMTQWADKIEADEAIGPDDVSLDIVGTVAVNDLLMHDDTGEIMRVTAFASGSSTMTVQRGLFDTTPAYITSGQDFYIIGSYIEQAGGAMPIFARRFGVDAARSTSIGTPREIELRALTTTGRGQLEYDDATGRTVDLLYRVKRPYPPGKVAVTQFVGALPTDDYVRVTWEHRNRLTRPFPQQTDDDLFIPEIHVRYLLDIYEEAPTPRLLRQEMLSNVAVKTFDYTYTMEDADRGGAGAADVLRFELWAERDNGVKPPDISDLSYYAQVRRIDRT
jgi:hypothetical protein